MNLVDSVGWIEFFTEGPLSKDYLSYLRDTPNLLTPTVVLYEVYKKVKSERTEEEALVAAAQISKTKIVALTQEIALSAADVSLRYGLPMADAIVYATALSESAQVVTSDIHFKGLAGVVFLEG